MASGDKSNARFDEVDALRGFALFGILLANILYWSGWVLATPEVRAAMAPPDMQQWQYRFHHFFIDGKFYTLFALLFGAGFAIQIERLERRGADGISLFRRRLFVLLGIGTLHSLLIWDGDILMLYALLGLLLPLMREWSERRLLIAAILLVFVVPVLGSLLIEAPGRPFFTLTTHLLGFFGWTDGPDIGVRMLPASDLETMLEWSVSGTAFSWGLRLDSWRIPKVLGVMILGMVAGRRLLAGSLLKDRRLQWRVLAGGAVVGVPFNLAYALDPNAGQASIPALFGTVPLALAYAASFLLAWPRAKSVLGLFAPPGRMALTNYLTHSLLGILIFIGPGLALVFRLSPPQFYAVALAIFTGQLIVSRWWLERFAQGPAEALWRRLTYAGTKRLANARDDAPRAP